MVETYEGNLPSPELINMEVARWKVKYQCLRQEDRPDSLAAAIKDCDPDCFPNLRILLQIECTLPVTCECEWSISALQRLRYYMCATMGGERQANLALIHIHYNREIDLDEVVSLYSAMHPRHMELDTIIKP